jgi:hypothetical protein
MLVPVPNKEAVVAVRQIKVKPNEEDKIQTDGKNRRPMPRPPMRRFLLRRRRQMELNHNGC